MTGPVAPGGKLDLEALLDWLRTHAGAAEVEVSQASLLAGGAIQENWRLDLQIRGGAWEGDRCWVLRRDRASQVGEGRTRSEEFALLQVARQAGVAVPEPVLCCVDPAVLGSQFFFMTWVPGTAAAHRLVRDDSLVPDRAALGRALGRQLARIHSVRPGHSRLAFLGAPPRDPALHAIDAMRARLDRMPRGFAAIEWGLAALERHVPAARETTLVHRDFRTGNFIVHEGRPAAVLDWEFAGWGDPREDVGWLFARCWRFGQLERRAGGVAQATDVLAGYSEQGGRAISEPELAYWELFAHVRWAVIAAEQTERHTSGRERSLELALTGRLLSQLEMEILHASRRLH